MQKTALSLLLALGCDFAAAEQLPPVGNPPTMMPAQLSIGGLSLDVEDDTTIYVSGGVVSAAVGAQANEIGRVTSDGVYLPKGGRTCALQPDGRILLGGQLTNARLVQSDGRPVLEQRIREYVQEGETVTGEHMTLVRYELEGNDLLARDGSDSPAVVGDLVQGDARTALFVFACTTKTNTLTLTGPA